MAEKLTAHSNGTPQNTIRFIVLCGIVVILLLIAGCQEDRPNDDRAVATETVVAETAVPTETAVVLEPEANPEIEGEIAVTSQTPVNVTALAAADLAVANIEDLPDTVNLAGDVYLVESDETAVTGQVSINMPADADGALLDMYGWDGSSWQFVPSEYDLATQQRRSTDHPLYRAIALGQAEPPDQITVGGVWSDEADLETWPEPLTQTIVGSLQLGAAGELEGSLSDRPVDMVNPFVQLTNVDDQIEVDALSALLADESAQLAHIDAIIDIVGPYAGVNLNYQGVAAEQKEAFSIFVQNLADALETQGKNLILTLPAPQNVAEVDDFDGYDWAMLGKIADTIYLQLPLDPYGYEEGGTKDQLLAWATDNIDRRKLVALIPTSVVVRTGDAWAPLTAEDQLMHFGELQFVNETAEYEPETAVEVTLTGEISAIEWDDDGAAYYYTVEDQGVDEVWLAHPGTVATRMDTAVKHNLQGVAFTAPSQPSEFSQVSAPGIHWQIFDEEGNIVVSEKGSETTFMWEGSADPGEFMLQVDYMVGPFYEPLGTLPVTIVAAEETEEAAESNEDTEIITGIVKRNANVRIGPGESYEKFPGPILKDTEVQIIGRDEFGYWLQIAFSNIEGEQIGWIATILLDVDPEFDISTLEDTSDILASASDNIVAEAPAAPTGATPEAETPAPPPASGPPPPVSAPPVAVGGFELGGQTHSFANPALMASAGMTWVKFQHKWGEGGNPGDLAGRINNAHGAGFKVLLSIPGANTYPESINFEEYVQFLAGVAALGPDAIEVWNEMNIDFEWPAGQIDPNSYVNNMLAPAYNAIKSVNPNVMVISGAPAPTGFDNNVNAWADNRYMAGMLAAGASRYADCIGAHYNAGASSPSLNSGHPTGSAHYSWYLLPTLNVYAQLGRPVCFTELGYLSGEDYGGVPDRFAWAADTSVAEHAAWLAEAVSVAANTGRVRMIIVFNVDFTQWGDDPQAGYAMIRKNGGCPACETLARVMGR